MHGWPSEKGEEFKYFQNRKEDFYTEQGCLMLGYRVVIPEKFRRPVLSE